MKARMTTALAAALRRQEQRQVDIEADYAVTLMSDRWLARQGHSGSVEHQRAVHMAWVEAMQADEAVSQ